MALTGLSTAGSTDGNYSSPNPGTYRDVFGFENGPDGTALPQIYEREVTIYGNRTLMGFLRTIGSEMATNSQQVRWVEQERLHIFSDNAITDDVAINADGEAHIWIGTNGGTDAAVDNTGDVNDPNHSFRANDKILVSLNSGTDPGTAYLAYIVAVVRDATGATGGRITVRFYDTASTVIAALPASSTVNLLVIGTEVGKSSNSRAETIQPNYKTYLNSTVIQRETFSINGTDSNQIGWVESVDENGAHGKYWYLKGKSETMLRWEDYMETSLLEDKFKQQGTVVGKGSSTNELGKATDAGVATSSLGGSQGLFDAISDRGNATTAGFSESDFIGDLDKIVEVLDSEGNIEENLFYLNRTESLAFDDGMSAQNNNFSNTNTSWGLFNNSEKMALNFGFSGARRGSYDFYKKDWKYLNQVDGRGSFGGVRGVSIPMGTKSVYDQYGANLQSPFASIHYLAGNTQNRKNISWAHGGSFGGGYNGLDSMNVEFLSEKCICLKGANNFILFG